MDLVSALVDADVVDVSALSRLLSSHRLVVVEDKDQTVLKTIDKACGSPLYSSKSSSYVLSAKGVSNFPAVAELGRLLSELAGSKFDITFVQDRDGMPDFIVPAFITSQQEKHVNAFLLERHEIENYLLQKKVIDVLGCEVITLVDKFMAAGTHSIEFDGTNLPNGIYFYRIKIGNYIETRKLILQK